jgi:hypothetical protein
VRNRKIENSIRYWIVYCTGLYTIFSPISNVYVLYAVWFERTEKPIIIVKSQQQQRFSVVEEYETEKLRIVCDTGLYTVPYCILSSPISNVYVLYAVWFERTEKPIIIVKSQQQQRFSVSCRGVRNRKIENSIRYWIVYCTVLYTIFSDFKCFVLYTVWFERTERSQ